MSHRYCVIHISGPEPPPKDPAASPHQQLAQALAFTLRKKRLGLGSDPFVHTDVSYGQARELRGWYSAHGVEVAVTRDRR